MADIERINFLARKSRTPEGLTQEEKDEQARLREEYLAGFRRNFAAQLENTYIVDKEGNKVKLTKNTSTDSEDN